jgi:hypothetical protein
MFKKGLTGESDAGNIGGWCGHWPPAPPQLRDDCQIPAPGHGPDLIASLKQQVGARPSAVAYLRHAASLPSMESTVCMGADDRRDTCAVLGISSGGAR